MMRLVINDDKDDDNDDDDDDDDDDLCICFWLAKGQTRKIMVGPFQLVVHCRVARKKTLS